MLRKTLRERIINNKLLPEPTVEQESDCSDKTIRIIFALFEDCQQEETFVAIKILI